jgi:hypothetical protein
MGDTYQQRTASIWGDGYSMGVQQHPMMESQYCTQQHQYIDPINKGYESTGFYNVSNENSGFYQDPFIPPGDPHPSMFKNNQQPHKAKVKQETNNQLRVGSWDPKFLQKSGNKKFRHNDGQQYSKGQISTWTDMKKNPGYSKIKKNRNTRKKRNEKGMHDDNNIFSQTFGGEPSHSIKFEVVEKPSQVPFMNYHNPPGTAKFNAFSQNLQTTRKAHDNFSGVNMSNFASHSFSETFQIQGPLKSSRLPKNNPIMEEETNEGLK